MIGDEFWGFMGFDNCEKEILWQEFELEYLKAAVDKIVNNLKTQRYLKTLKNENKRFQTTMDAIDSPIYVSDMKTYKLLFLNKIATKIFGSKIGEKCYSVLQNLDQPCDFCTNHLLLDMNGKPKGPHIWKFQNSITKQWYHCHDQAIKWSDDRLVRFEIATDITALEENEQKIKEREEYYRALIENNSSVISILDNKGTSKYKSPSYEKVIGYKPEEIKDNFEHIHPEDRARIQKQFINLLNRYDDIEKISYRFLHKNGTWRNIEGTAKNLLNNPEINGIVTN